MIIKPTIGNIFIKIVYQEEKNTGKIIKPYQSKEQTVGIVINDYDSWLVKAGDKIIFTDGVGQIVMVEGIEHRIIKETDILATIKDE
jgi:chaperonin GroES